MEEIRESVEKGFMMIGIMMLLLIVMLTFTNAWLKRIDEKLEKRNDINKD